ncbi:MAG: endonuclease/exonuclease/phosphatase family protein [Oscillospiraceae bacterium]|nr:endonuclease/exonuclease/phosphatase family protein [Oscillospiraceae bacterium]
MKAKTIVRIVLILLLALILAVISYVAYVLIDYHRLPDWQRLEVVDNPSRVMDTETPYSILSWNIGFGAYSQDFSFFMDGGKHSRAYSEEEVLTNVSAVSDLVVREDPDLIVFQEVDVDATRSWHVNEAELLTSASAGCGYVEAVNYDSPYLMYPIFRPHGKSLSELLTVTSFSAESAGRRSLPVEDGFRKLIDLDRCYSVTDIPVANGRTLRLYNLHLSAYTSDGSIATDQLRQLISDMSQAYAAGNYAIAGGDFNKDLLGNSSEVFGVSGKDYSWSQAFPIELLPKNLTLQVPFDASSPVPSCRNCDIGYEPGVTFVLTVDGFLTTPNVRVSDCRVIDDSFLHSDHNPVSMTFTLKDD